MQARSGTALLAPTLSSFSDLARPQPPHDMLVPIDDTALSPGDWRLTFYFTVLFIGGAGLTLLLLTLMLPSKRIRRNPLLISLVFTWWLCPFPSLSLLLFADRLNGPLPSQALCLGSAALVMAQTPLNTMSGVMLIYHVWSVLLPSSKSSEPSRLRTLIHVLLPYVVYLIFVGVVVAVGLARPDTVVRAPFYCIVRVDPLMIALGAFSAAGCLFAIVLEIWIAFILRQDSHRVLDQGMDIRLVFRVFGFGFFIFLGLALSVLSILDWTSVVPDLFFSTYGVAVFFIFGTQKDVISVWASWLCGNALTNRSTERQRQSSFDNFTPGDDPSGIGGDFSKSHPGALPQSLGSPNSIGYHYDIDPRHLARVRTRKSNEDGYSYGVGYSSSYPDSFSVGQGGDPSVREYHYPERPPPAAHAELDSYRPAFGVHAIPVDRQSPLSSLTDEMIGTAV